MNKYLWTQSQYSKDYKNYSHGCSGNRNIDKLQKSNSTASKRVINKFEGIVTT